MEEVPKPKPNLIERFTSDMDVGDERTLTFIVPDEKEGARYPVTVNVRHSGGAFRAEIGFPVGGKKTECLLDEAPEVIAEYFGVTEHAVETAPTAQEKDTADVAETVEESTATEVDTEQSTEPEGVAATDPATETKPSARLIRKEDVPERRRTPEGPPSFLRELKKPNRGWQWIAVGKEHADAILKLRKALSETDLRETGQMVEDEESGHVALTILQKDFERLKRLLPDGAEFYEVLGHEFPKKHIRNGEIVLGPAVVEKEFTNVDEEDEPTAASVFGEDATFRRPDYGFVQNKKGSSVQVVRKRKKNIPRGPNAKK